MPLRTCLSCRKVRDKKGLIRLAAQGSVLTADVKGILPGRGVYLCPEPSCVRNAYKKKEQFSRSLKRNVSLIPLEEFLNMVTFLFSSPLTGEGRVGVENSTVPLIRRH